MIPAGIERDKQVAELRGDDRVCGFDTCAYMMSPAHDCDDCQYLIDKPYSTDISCAMELWEEMKQGGCNLYLHYNAADAAPKSIRGIAVEVIKPSYKINDLEWVKGETEADAISGAWLKWKERV